MIVLRRKTPRFNGTRYYAMPHQVQRYVKHAAKFDTPEAAETARRTLREPWLWEVMPEEDAARLDAQGRERYRKQMTAGDSPRERHALRLYAAIAAVSARGMAV